ncbi:MAG TPA: class I SAM-dependent methyltransferase, partial [Anaerolineae bacterium]
IYQVEDQHWWYTGMRQITITLIASLYRDRSDLQILDAGCGTGAAMAYLSAFGAVTGCDLFTQALDFCRLRGLSCLSQATVTRLPFAAESFDLVTSFDVLYHRAVGDYQDALVEFHRVLKPDGRVLLRLPAYNWLRSHHDDIIHTARRFTTNELRQALIASHFAVEKLSYANTLLFPLALGKRVAERFFSVNGSTSDIHPNPPWQDRLLARFLFAEARWLVHWPLPFGLSVIAIGRKR